MCIAQTATAFWHHFHPWIIHNIDLEAVSYFGSPNYRKVTNMTLCPKCVPGHSQMHPKIDKNIHLDLKVPVGCLTVPKMEPQGLKIIVLGINSDSFQQSTQSAAAC